MIIIQTIMETMFYFFVAFLVWFVVVIKLHTTMTPEQIKESGNFFKKVLVYIDITKIMNFFERSIQKKKDIAP